MKLNLIDLRLQDRVFHGKEINQGARIVSIQYFHSHSRLSYHYCILKIPPAKTKKNILKFLIKSVILCFLISRGQT